MKHWRSLFCNQWMPLAVLVLGDLLMVAGVLPRETSFVLALGAVLFVWFAPRSASLFFLVAAIPFSPALPIPSFDTFALWRLTVSAFALRTLIEHPDIRRRRISPINLVSALRSYEWFGVALLVLAGISLMAAQDLVFGFRKLVFLLNAILLYGTLRILLPRYPNLLPALLSGLLVGLGGLLLFGASQYIGVSFVSLYEFWQGWALDGIPVFYGEELGTVLSQSNTWFSYYADSPPTLRMFSLLPDSHSFGLLMLLGFTLALGILGGSRTLRREKKWMFWLLAAGFALAVLLNGSRGIWLTAILPALLALAATVWGKDDGRPQLLRIGKTALAGFVILAALFPTSSFLTSLAHGAGVGDGGGTLAFSRAKSIFDADEASNRGRLDIWKAGAESVLAHPLLGVGFGNTATALSEDVAASRRGASAHNLYLDFAVETGIAGGLVSLLFFVALLRQFCIKALRGLLALDILPIAFSFGLAAIWIGAYNLFDIVLLNDRALLTLLAFLAIATTRSLNPSTRQTT